MIIKQEKNHQHFINLFTLFVINSFKYLLVIAIVGLIVFILISQTSFFNPTLEISPSGNFFEEPIEIVLSVNGRKNLKIFYTVDGSEPSIKSLLYENPIKINRTTTLRAILFDQENRAVSQLISHDFFIEAKHKLPIVSLVTDPDNLWDEESGIYVEGNHQNYLQRGSKWQRPATFTFYEPDSKSFYKKEIGIRMHGGHSREVPQRAFRLYSSMDNPNDLFEYPFFKDYEITKFNTLILRSSGNDWWRAYLRDPIITRLVAKGTDLDYMAVRPVVLYLNGEYWGLYFLRDRFDREYLHQKYKIDQSQISLLDIPSDYLSREQLVLPKDNLSKEDAKLFNQLLEGVASCADCGGYSHYDQYISMSHLIEYYIYQFYFYNVDWPFNNVNIWRYNNSLVSKDPQLSRHFSDGQDGRFRFYIYDLDSTFANTSNTSELVAESAKNSAYSKFIIDQFPFKNLFNNPTFLENYLNQTANLLNTTLSSESVISEIDNLVDEINDEMPRQIERWKDERSNINNYQFVQSMDEWQHEIQLIKDFAIFREDGFKEINLDQFHDFLIKNQMVKLNVSVSENNAGSIKIHNHIFKPEELPFEGEYFPGFYINLEALPDKGYNFSHWEGDVVENEKNSAKIRVPLIQNYQLEAVFIKSKSFTNF